MDGTGPASGSTPDPRHATPRRRQWLSLAAASGIIPAFMLYRVGWSLLGAPPAAHAGGPGPARILRPDPSPPPEDTRRTRSARSSSRAAWPWQLPCPDWEKLVHASLGGLVLFAVFFFINLMNPRWIAYGDVRLALVVGFGLAWVSPMALLDGFFYANLMAAVVGPRPHRPAPGQAKLGVAVRALPGPGGRPGPGHLELSPRAAGSAGRSRWHSADRANRHELGSTR